MEERENQTVEGWNDENEDEDQGRGWELKYGKLD